jgi:hypothetical protein
MKIEKDDLAKAECIGAKDIKDQGQGLRVEDED